MIDRGSIRFFAYFARAYPSASMLMTGLLVLAGLLEGVGVLSLVPLLAVATRGTAVEGGSAVAEVVTSTLSHVGLEPTIGVLVTLIVVSMSLKSVALWVAMREVGFTIARVARDLRLSLVRALMHARWSHFGTQQLGRYANAISSETNAATAAYREAATVLAALIQILIYVTVSVLVSWQATVVALTVGGLLFAGLRPFVIMARNSGREQVALTRSLAGRIVDTLQGIKAIKAMALEDRVLPILEKETHQLNRAQQKRVTAGETPRIIQEPVSAAVLGLGLYVLIVVQQQPFATVLVLAFIFQRLISQLHTLYVRYQVVVTGEAAFWSVCEQLDRAEAEVERERSDEAVIAPRFEHEIRFDNVEFSFPGKPLLNGLSLRIPHGAFVALSGPSGVGKTTILDLLLGLLTPHKGEIYIDEVPLSDVRLREWRESLGYVPQEMLLFNDSIRDNITLGDRRISDEHVERALRSAGAWEFVTERAGGLDATMGNAGIQFSGGQRQRLAIARALVRSPRLLILDEATTALDPESEQGICETLERLRGRITIVAISHQPRLHESADVVYHVQNGSLREVQRRMVEGAMAIP